MHYWSFFFHNDIFVIQNLISATLNRVLAAHLALVYPRRHHSSHVVVVVKEEQHVV